MRIGGHVNQSGKVAVDGSEPGEPSGHKVPVSLLAPPASPLARTYVQDPSWADYRNPGRALRGEASLLVRA